MTTLLINKNNSTKKNKNTTVIKKSGRVSDSISVVPAAALEEAPIWFRRFETNINIRLDYIETEVKELKEDVGTLKEDVTILKEDVGTLKEDVKILKEDVGTLKEDVTILKEDVGTLKEDVKILKEDVGTLKEDVKILKEDVDTLKEDVKILKEDVDTLKEDVKILKEDVDTLKEDVKILKEDVGILKEDVETLKNDVGTLKENVENLNIRVGSIENTMGVFSVSFIHPHLYKLFKKHGYNLKKSKTQARYKVRKNNKTSTSDDDLLGDVDILLNDNGNYIAVEVKTRIHRNHVGKFKHFLSRVRDQLKTDDSQFKSLVGAMASMTGSERHIRRIVAEKMYPIIYDGLGVKIELPEKFKPEEYK
ncbi:MAG: hypothetical protein LBE18_11615 [Planctomycetaceae bacterium]|jgi:peptidoglycan hydrolase CwlO-like protein|nr:hypothetical protein [Planctomycetaceae bacterium]